ncbi:MAG: glycosyltransferase [Burkholderiales bacterium]|nr:glycosyltransferase [Phycisphaerae bacterium]
MKYVLLTHIPTFAGQSSGVIRWSTEWEADLSAQVAALREVGFDVTVATPLLPAPDSQTLAKQALVDVTLKKQDFTYQPLPGYRTMTQFVTHRPALRRAIRALIKDADIVQLGAGGHPISLGQVAWPIVKRAGRKCIFVFSDDPIPAWRRYAETGRNPAKRLAKSMAIKRLERFCATAVREADLVFAHSPEVQDRFGRAWSETCHTFAPTRLRDSQIGKARVTPDKNRPLRVVTIGSAGFTRGVDHLLRALAKARRLNAKIELDLVGDVTGSAELMNLLRDQRLEPAIRLHGRLSGPKLTAVLDQADVLAACELIPAIDPIIYLAIARGLPILTYQSGVLDQRLTDHGAGIVIPRGETDLFAQALLDLATKTAGAAAMSQRAIDLASEKTLDAVHRTRAGLARSLIKRK